MNKYLIRKISFIICLLLVLSFVQSYAGVHFGIISAVKSKVQELKNKKEAQEHITTETVDSAGGEIELPDGASVVIPPGVLNSTTTVTLTKYDTPLTSIDNEQSLTPTYRLQIPTGNINSSTGTLSGSIVLRMPVGQASNSSISQSQNSSLSDIVEKVRVKIGNYPCLYTVFKITNDIIEIVLPADLISKIKSQTIDYELVKLFPLASVQTKLFTVTNNPYRVLESTSVVNSGKVPVIFIHGLVSLGDTSNAEPHLEWGNLIKYLFAQNLNFEPFLFRYDTKKSIASNSTELKQVIDDKFKNASKIIIVAHSMGGLVSHNYIQNLNGYEKVSKLITLGTPFHGSPLAGAEITTKALVANDGNNDLKWDYYNETSSTYDGVRNQFLYDLYKSTTVYSSTKYVAFAGTFDSKPQNTDLEYDITNDILAILSIKYSQPSWAFSDCVVPWISATYDGRSDLISAKHEYENYDHSELKTGQEGLSEDDPIFGKISEEISVSLPPVNHAPTISSLTANPTSVSTGTISTITCVATDSDGDTLTYNWSTLSGIITGTGEQVSWTAPVSSGTYTITCLVSDGKGGSDTESVNILVKQNSTTNSKIAFRKNRDIYVMNADGSNKINLTKNQNSPIYYAPEWSPDGNKIAFLQNDEGRFDINVMNADGSNKINLTKQYSSAIYGGSLEWSPDGNQIAYSSYGEIYVMNADGSNKINLTNSVSLTSHTSCYHPEWSPDGNKIAFETDTTISVIPVGDGAIITGYNEIYVMNADGSNQINLTNDSSNDYIDPEWSPDGSKIAFKKNKNGGEALYIMNADGSNKIYLDDNLYYTGGCKWSPDGNKIAYSSSGDLCVINADGSNKINLTNNGSSSNYFDPEWSPDGNKIVFDQQNYTSGSDKEIYIINADGSNQVNLTNDPSNDDDGPVWSPVINNLPNAPTSVPYVSTPVYVNRSYTYSISATDPDNDKVKYRFDWGNGQTSETEYVNSGTVASISHIWTTVGTKSVKVKTIDSKGNESLNWSPVLSILVNLDPGSNGEI